MIEILLPLVVILLLVCIAMQAAVLRRRPALDVSPLHGRLDAFDRAQERTERAVREEIATGREESGAHARGLREEVGASMKGMGELVLQNLGEMSGAQQKQLDGLLGSLTRLTETNETGSSRLREELGTTLKGLNDSVLRSVGDLTALQKAQLEGFSTQLGRLTESNEQRLEALRGVVETKLQHIREDNTRQLEQMRQTVDEKLQGALEQRLGESFRLVSERLEQVHNGLGEMKNLASGVGDLKKVLTNVKVRGTWGEIQLGNLLEQVLTPEQYATNVVVCEGSSERVEFAIKLPGRGDHEGDVVWLPIDAKFPQEDYQRLVEAQEHADPLGVEVAGKALENRIRACAKDVCDKYLNPPRTTDFAILFLPTEGLYAEVVRRTGLMDMIQREWRVVVAGPTTLWALLNSLQMGFRTLAIQKRSSEVWTVLGAVKTEFGKFGGVLDKVQKKLQEASNVVEDAGRRKRAVERKLKDVQELSVPQAEELLLGVGATGLGELDRGVEEWGEE
ncbi:MAG: DNA recombination protein RmuC [Gemmatimonadetes bacterium]|nr:DNA recombination protein RmuC [Gemmatimonadota bacterium]